MDECVKTCKVGHVYTGKRCPECKRVYHAKWYREHKSKADERVRQWIKNHSEYRQRQHEWYIAHKDIAKARSTQWAKDHREQHNMNQKRSKMGMSKKRSVKNEAI